MSWNRSFQTGFSAASDFVVSAPVDLLRFSYMENILVNPRKTLEVTDEYITNLLKRLHEVELSAHDIFFIRESKDLASTQWLAIGFGNASNLMLSVKSDEHHWKPVHISQPVHKKEVLEALLQLVCTKECSLPPDTVATDESSSRMNLNPQISDDNYLSDNNEDSGAMEGPTSINAAANEQISNESSDPSSGNRGQRCNVKKVVLTSQSTPPTAEAKSRSAANHGSRISIPETRKSNRKRTNFAILDSSRGDEFTHNIVKKVSRPLELRSSKRATRKPDRFSINHPQLTKGLQGSRSQTINSELKRGKRSRTWKQTVDGRLNRLEVKMHQIEGKMDQIEGKMDQIEGKMDQIEGKMDQIEGKMDQIASKMEQFMEEFMEIRNTLALIRKP